MPLVAITCCLGAYTTPASRLTREISKSGYFFIPIHVGSELIDIHAKTASVQILLRPLEPQRRPGPLRPGHAPRPIIRLETRPAQKARIRGDDVSRRRCRA